MKKRRYRIFLLAALFVLLIVGIVISFIYFDIQQMKEDLIVPIPQIKACIGYFCMK